MEATIEKAVERMRWQDVPRRVPILYKQASTIRDAVRQRIDDNKLVTADPGYGNVWWKPDEKKLWATVSDGDEQEQIDRWKTALQDIPQVKDVEVAAESSPSDSENWIKVAKGPQSLEWLGKPHSIAQSLMGGPNPLTNVLVSGLVGSGLGYGAGYLGEKLFPERFVGRGRLRKNLALLGGLGGAALPAWQAAAAMQNRGLSGLVQRTQPNYFSKSSSSRFADLAEELYRELGLHESFVDAATKFAVDRMRPPSTGTFEVESVPVDAFNNTVWNDVRRGAAQYNPYGSKSPWGSNRQQLFNPPSPPEAAVASGLVSGASAQSGKSMLSPADIARGIVNAGIGAASAKALGAVAGAFFGVKPKAREQLENMGALGGLVTPIVQGMF